MAGPKIRLAPRYEVQFPDNEDFCMHSSQPLLDRRDLLMLSCRLCQCSLSKSANRQTRSPPDSLTERIVSELVSGQAF